MTVVLASQNQGKLKEMSAILGEMDIQVVLQSQVGVDIEVEETGTTFAENALLKAKAVMEATNMVAIADDSGLSVDALDGAPGVYSARFGGCNTDEERVSLMLQKMESVPTEKRTARFTSNITCCYPDGRVISAEGTCEGTITTEPAGDGGFGYDPIFYYEPLGKTFSELTAQEKNKISHRSVALQRFCDRLMKEQL
ncbi:MAG: XTP/dITP diphosphatase [Eubacteriales bacterium]